MHPWVKEIQVCCCWNKGPSPFSREDNYEIAKIRQRNIKIFFPRTTGSISTKLGTKHPFGDENLIKFIQMKCPALFQREIITKNWKCIDEIEKIFFSRTTEAISTKFGPKHPCGPGPLVYFFKWKVCCCSKLIYKLNLVVFWRKI